jgi:hypothetical protein
LAGEPFYQGQNDRRQGVVAYNSRSDPSFTLFVTSQGYFSFVYLQITESYQSKPNAREVFFRNYGIDFLQSLPGFRADLSE